MEPFTYFYFLFYMLPGGVCETLFNIFLAFDLYVRGGYVKPLFICF